MRFEESAATTCRLKIPRSTSGRGRYSAIRSKIRPNKVTTACPTYEHGQHLLGAAGADRRKSVRASRSRRQKNGNKALSDAMTEKDPNKRLQMLQASAQRISVAVLLRKTS